MKRLDWETVVFHVVIIFLVIAISTSVTLV